jgi:beta-lactamase regulating signal transducer with metallopeptidase domain
MITFKTTVRQPPKYALSTSTDFVTALWIVKIVVTRTILIALKRQQKSVSVEVARRKRWERKNSSRYLYHGYRMELTIVWMAGMKKMGGQHVGLDQQNVL